MQNRTSPLSTRAALNRRATPFEAIRTAFGPGLSFAGRVLTLLYASALAPAPLAAQTAHIPAEPLNQQYQIQGGQNPKFRPLRYDEDFSFLRDPKKAKDYTAPIKYIRLGHRDDYFLTLGGQLRAKFEQYAHYPFAMLPRPGMPVAPSPADQGGYLLQRYHLHTDLHLGYQFRFFGELKSNAENDYNGGPQPPQTDAFDYNQAFADFRVSLKANNAITLRGGRQEILYGGGRLLTSREGPNARLSFDGAKILVQTGSLRADAFVLQPVGIGRYAWDNHPIRGQTLWGLYATTPLRGGKNPMAGNIAGEEATAGGAATAPEPPKGHSANPDSHEAESSAQPETRRKETGGRSDPVLYNSNIDGYYLGWDDRNAVYDQGQNHEVRHTIGTRWFGQNGKLDYNVEGAYQWGRFGNGDINAYSLSEDVGYIVATGRPKIRLGLRSDFQTGDRSRQTPGLQTFNPLFSRGDLYDEAGFFSSSNVISTRSSLDIYPGKGVTVSLAATLFWRQSVADGLYAPGRNPVVGDAGNRSRFIATQPTAQVFWQADRHTTLTLNYSHLFADTYLRAANGHAADYFTGIVSYVF